MTGSNILSIPMMSSSGCYLSSLMRSRVPGNNNVSIGSLDFSLCCMAINDDGCLCFLRLALIYRNNGIFSIS